MGQPSFDNEMKEILESFIVETNEILEKLGQDLLALEKDSTNSELHNVIFRAVHTVKGTSSFLGFERMTHLAHKFEDVLNKIRKGEIIVTSPMMDIMFEAYDLLRENLQSIEKGNYEGVEIEKSVEKLNQISTGTLAQGQNEQTPEPLKTERSANEVDQKEVNVIETNILAESSEPSAAPTPEPGSQEKDNEAPQQKDLNNLSHTAESTIRVDVSRLDVLMNLVGELVLGRNRLAQIAHQMNEELDSNILSRELAETSSHIDFITTELQMAIMKTRMVPIARVFNRLPRLVRELSKETKKEIELEIIGEDTELDKSLIEELNDPLIHMIRNSADHGIESPEERQAAGKPPVGKVVVNAYQEGNHIVIFVSDDGKGMDTEKLKAKAIEKGIITPEAAAEMSTSDAYNLIFLPGFSTAQVVTNVSGRGVGMDVVRSHVQKLKGTIEVVSELGKGTSFIIKLPLTLAIIQALLVESNGEIFSIPLDSVIEVVRVGNDEIDLVGGNEVIRLRDAVLPLTRLSSVLGSINGTSNNQWKYIVVIGVAERRLGIIVDALLGQKEVVIKSISESLGEVRGIAGSTILGDGRVIMIVDVAELIRFQKSAA
ncbi:MAG TPA: chemotaxis protein CheA [Bacteroidota bacterium]|nr:chemotaxis protein CheA [Bacteroidota bacterium]